jgi:nucleoside-diphosphate-sugar epimerase
MKIALTGATGFLGRYIARRLSGAGHTLRAWHRPGRNPLGFEKIQHSIEWVAGELGDEAAARDLLKGCDAAVHAALYRPGAGFRGAEGELGPFLEKNFLGSMRLMESALSLGVPRFVLISTCAVHEVVLEDRPLDENHPTRPKSHYGAMKAALEQFVQSFGLGRGYPICALRPVGIYGLAFPHQDSKWYELVNAVVKNQPVSCMRGGKEVHAADVARAVEILLGAESVAGQMYNCYDLYVSEREVAECAKAAAGSQSAISGESPRPLHQIDAAKLRGLGMTFGGRALLEKTVHELVEIAR